jgi:PAS domain S-box-containing protein
MTDSSINRRQSHASALAAMAGYFAIGVAALVLVGWEWRIEILKRLFEGNVSMNPVTAVCLAVAGLSLVMQVRRPRRLARVLAVVIIVMGLLKLCSYLWGWSFPVDQWMFPTELHLNEPVEKNRIAPNTALGLTFLGLGLLTLDCRTIRGIQPAEIFAMGLALVASLVIVGYIYQIKWLFGVASHIPMAVHTASVFLILALGLVLARPDRGLMAIVTSESTGGLLARHLFPAVVLVFVLAGALKLVGERRGYYATGQGEALYTVLSIGIFGGFVLWTARSLHRVDLERKRIEKERESFFSLSLDLFGIAGMDGYFKRVNPAFCRTLGYTEKEILMRPYYDLIHPDDVAATKGEGDTLFKGRPSLHFENRYRCKDGSWKWLEWNTLPFVNEGILHAVGRDVTEKKRVEAELHQQACHLESLNLELEAFSYSVSHDLRAPLRGIFGFSQALEERESQNLDPTSLGYLHRIRNAAAFMGELIDDLLQLSRLTRAEMKVESVNLSEMAQELIADHRRAEGERKVETVIAPDIKVVGDPALLRAMLGNLLANAWKFTSRNPEARIELGRGPVESGLLSCFVRDNGVGFDNRYAHKLFGAFQRLHSQAEFKGSGIGLATVRRIILRHGGEVSGEGVIDGGATFHFSLNPAITEPNP